MPTPLRVLAVGNVYPPHHLGGYEIIWHGVDRELRHTGHTVRVLTTDHRNSGGGGEQDVEVYRELEWYWRSHAWRRLTPRARWRLEQHNASTFDRHLGEVAPDVIAWWPLGGLSLGLIERARRAGIPSVFFVLDPWPYYGEQRDQWLRMARNLGMARGLLERATGLPTTLGTPPNGRWVFCSQSMRDHTLAKWPDIDQSVVLTPGVTGEYLTAPVEPTPPPWRWQLLYIGRVVEQKGVGTAIEALALLPATATLRIVGDGDARYRSELMRIAGRLGVSARVSFEPARPRAEVVELYRAADAVLFPVVWDEPWGLVPLEAMALGRPVVATGRGGSGDYLEHGANSLLFTAGDADGLAAALRELAGDRELRERLRRGGRRTAEEHSDNEFNRRSIAELMAAARTR
jgi:glycosyltransferase involved in cell wall biosynthesis